ncbi:MAG TPA: nuclear transport factor 2 family protein [Verrucomicrobiales bacterium]|nr:nuclear transport factor 2 family protein [Verrucomicrobiales bacterium]
MKTASPHTSAAELISRYFRAYERKDPAALGALLTEDFTFSSPLDDNISREAYFARCWPNSTNHRDFRIERCFEEGDEAFVTYTCERMDGARFRNTEFFLTDGERIRHVDVYFGSDEPADCEEAAVRGVIDETVRAIRARDTAALMGCYADNVCAFDLLPPLQYKSAADLERRAGDWLSSFEGTLEYELRDLRIVASGGCAFAHSLNHVRGRRPDGMEIDMWWRATLGLEKRDGTWLITHGHSSEPFNMETGQAEVGLKP